MNSKRFDELKSTGALPSPTGVGMEILRLTRNDCASIEEIARVLQTDPALSGRTLKYANTGNAASNRPITTIRDAIVRIGVRAVSGIALGFSVASTCRTAACTQFDCRRYWSHSLAIALGAQAIAQRLRAVAPDEGFLSGLLGQIGRLALASVHPEKYSEVLAAWGGCTPVELIRLEQAAFATDHNELTGALLNDWGLPEFFATAVLLHEQPDDCDLPEEGEERQLARVLHAAVRLADICVADDDYRAAALVPEFLRRIDRLGIDSDDVIQIVEECIAQWQEWGRILNVGTSPVSSFAELLSRSWEIEAQEQQQSSATDPVEPASQENSGDAASEPSPQMPRKGLRILVADDDPVTLRVLSKLLTSSGHEVCAATNGRDALRLALDTNPQLVITDWMMPETSGVEFCRSLRQTRFGRQVYIIILTSQSDESHLVEAFESGADDFVVKPFQAKPLFARIRAGLRVIKLQDELSRDKERIDKVTAELAIANRRLEMDALTDVLTGLPNRRYLVERLSHDWAMARRSGQPLTCMVLDIDHFKRINDTLGHDVGDRVLEKVAEVLKSCIRGTDVVCRYGGEEFVVVGADSDLDSSLKCAERLRHAVETEASASFPQLERPVTVSIGVALRNESTRTPEMLLKAADEALYQAKQTGRNRVCSAVEASPALRAADDSRGAAAPSERSMNVGLAGSPSRDGVSQSFLAHQPIYDRELNAVAYELLYRNSRENQATIADGHQATGEVVFNALVEMGLEQVIGNETAYVNVTSSFLLGGHCEALPRERVVLEVLEDVEPSDEVIKALEYLSLEGYRIALDDFVVHDRLRQLIRIADVVKIDVRAHGREGTLDQVRRLKEFDVQLLAEKVETYEEFEYCRTLGMSLFQGYFVCQPQILANKPISADRLGTMQLLSRLQDGCLEIAELEKLLMRDPAICIKLLRYINSSHCGLRNHVDSIRHAATLVGLRKIRIWAGLLMFGSFNDKPRELIRAANIRARMCERLAEYLLEKNTDRCFTVGLLSLLDAFADAPMSVVLSRLPLSPEITGAILDGHGPAGRILTCVTAYERGDWQRVNSLQLPCEIVRNAYFEAISWTQTVIDQMQV